MTHVYLCHNGYREELIRLGSGKKGEATGYLKASTHGVQKIAVRFGLGHLLHE
jgi:hypothetical protein